MFHVNEARAVAYAMTFSATNSKDPECSARPEHGITIDMGDSTPDPQSACHDVEYVHPGFSSFSVKEFLERPVKKAKFVVEGLFRPGDVTLLAASTGIGKSYLVLQAAICVAAGRPFLDLKVECRTAIGLFY